MRSKCYNKIKPVYAEQDWTEPVGQCRGKLFKVDDSQILPTATGNNDVLTVINDSWTGSSSINSRTTIIDASIELLKSKRDTIQNTRNRIRGMIG